MDYQQISLEQQIADYQQMVETTRQDGRALRRRLEKEGWKIIDSLLDLNRNPCAVHPKLWADLTHSDLISLDPDDEYYRIDVVLTHEEWKQIVELPVMD